MNYYLAFAFSVALALGVSATGMAQTNKPKEATAATSKPDAAAGTTRKIPFSLKEQQETEYTCIFKEGITYVIELNVPDIAASKLQLQILDGQKKPMQSKVSNLKSEPVPSISFPCKASGMYFFKVTPL